MDDHDANVLTHTTREVARVFAVPLKNYRHHKCLPDDASGRDGRYGDQGSCVAVIVNSMTTTGHAARASALRNARESAASRTGRKRNTRSIFGPGATCGRAAGPSERLSTWWQSVADHGSSLRWNTSAASLSEDIAEVNDCFWPKAELDGAERGGVRD